MNILKVFTPQRKLGSFGERAAAKELKRLGYKILERNYAPEDGEIDIIAEKDGTTAFVEVKTRHRSDGTSQLIEPRPASAVTPKKQSSIITTARIFLATHRGTRARFDIVEVYVSGDAPRWRVAEIKHIVGAFGKKGYM